MLLAAADGDFPPVDGRARFVPPLGAGLSAVVSFTGHAVVATSLSPADLGPLRLDGYGAALRPAVLQHLAGLDGDVGVIDVTLVARGVGGGSGGERLPRLEGFDDHPRVRHARGLRQGVEVHGDERGLVTLALGLAGRTELSIETTEAGLALGSTGVGRSLLRDALTLVPAGAPVFAAVSPGNARSLRALLSCGFVPVGSEVLIRSAPALPDVAPVTG